MEMGQPFPILATTGELFDPGIFETAFHASCEGMAVAENGIVRSANPAFVRLLGHSSSSTLIGKPLARFRPKRHPCEFARVGAQESRSKGHLCQFVSQRRDGTPLRIESTCISFRMGAREFQLITIRDVSVRERRRMVRDGHERFRVIFEAAHMGILQCDLQGFVLESNPAVERMLDYSHTELRGMCLHDIAHSEAGDGHAALFRELAEGKRESYELEARYVAKSSATGCIRLTVSLVRGVDGKPQFAIVMTEDITDRKRAEERLRQAEKMEVVGRLVSGVAHDFNNLLTGIMLYCDLLITALPADSGRLKHHADEIRLAGEQGSALIQQLLAAARQQTIQPKILCLNEIIQKTRNLLSRLLGEKYDLSLDLRHDLGNVKIDPAQVQQVLFNLVLNARDAMSQGGRIEVTTGHHDLISDQPSNQGNEGVFLSVKDSGCGMSAETRARLFEPFFTTKATGRGTGLGLSTVQTIITNGGGSVIVDSELGQGTRITVVLPRASESRTPDPASFSPAKPRETILLLEDNVTIRQAASRILSECGYTVLEAASGPEAIDLATEHAGKIDLLLADVDLPGMSGNEAAVQICAERTPPKVLYMSGRDGHVDASAEATVFFKKPFSSSALLEKVREILDGPIHSKKSAKRKREKP
jgi:two-component system, cell cycle sensor histidine kinase and response regulator CckA